MNHVDNVVQAGGFPSDRYTHAATRSVLGAVESRGIDHDFIGFYLDDDDEDGTGDGDTKADARHTIESRDAALRRRDIDADMERVRTRLEGGEDTVGEGLCFGATLLAGYQEAARNRDWPEFTQIVLLDPVPGITTDNQELDINSYSGEDAVGIYDDAIPARDTVNGLPYLKTDGGGHLWQYVVDGFGDAVLTTAHRTAGRDQSGQYAALNDVASAYDGFAEPMSQKDKYLTVEQSAKGRFERLREEVTSLGLGYRPSPGAD